MVSARSEVSQDSAARHEVRFVHLFVKKHERVNTVGSESTTERINIRGGEAGKSKPDHKSSNTPLSPDEILKMVK